MRLFYGSVLAVAIASLVPTVHGAPLQELDKPVPGGGIFIQGWTGKIDPQSVTQGRTINDAKLAQEGNAIHLTTGPAGDWWNPANTASGDYTVKATFMEPKYMNLNTTHPHSYGLFIGGNSLGTDQQTMLYCETYGDGTFIVRGFNPAPFSLGAPRKTANPAVHKAAGAGEPVTQDIALSVKAGRVECSVNGTVVAGYDKADWSAKGLQAVDGVYGFRATHNVEVMITNFGKQ